MKSGLPQGPQIFDRASPRRLTSAASFVTKPSSPEKFAIRRRRADLLINISNDGWFGRSPRRNRSAHGARPRTWKIAAGCCVSPTTVSTVSVDPYGRVFSVLPPDVRAAVDCLTTFATDETIYTALRRLVCTWLCVLVSVIPVSLNVSERKHAREELLIPVTEIPPSL